MPSLMPHRVAAASGADQQIREGNTQEALMFSSMGAVDAWDTKQDQATLWDEIKTSPCLTCAHRKDDKNKCKLLPTCPIRIPTITMTTSPKQTNPKRHYANVCKFPGCKNPCSNEYCSGKNGHQQLMYTRRKRHPNNPERWHLPVVRGGRGNSLSKRLKNAKTD